MMQSNIIKEECAYVLSSPDLLLEQHGFIMIKFGQIRSRPIYVTLNE